MRKHTPPQSLFFLVGEEITHCPPTVLGGDTPCVTAGDADNFPTPAVSHSIHSCYSLNAFSATPPASEISGAAYPTGSPSLCSGITRG